MTISLYHAAHDVQNQIALCIDDDGALDTDKLDAIQCSFHDRAVATVAVYKGTGHTIEMLEGYLAEIQSRITKYRDQQKRLKDNLHAAMIVAGVDKIKSDDGLLTAILYRDRDESIAIDDGAVFPLELCTEPRPPEPSRTKIKAAIMAGEAIAGARIVRKDRLKIG